MVSSTQKVKLRFKSGPYCRRPGLYPMAVILALSWVFSFMWLFVALWVFQYNPFWSVTLMASSLAFGSFLGYLTYTMIDDACREYQLELTDDEAVLSVVDRLHKKRSVQMVLLNDVSYAEYYPFQDSASIIFHAPYAEMEVPLWPLGSAAADVVDFLHGRGVNVVNVQSDESIPG